MNQKPIWINAVVNDNFIQPIRRPGKRKKTKGIVMISIVLIITVVLMIIMLYQNNKKISMTNDSNTITQMIKLNYNRIEELQIQIQQMENEINNIELGLANKKEDLDYLSFTKKCIKKKLIRRRPFMSAIFNNETEVDRLLNWISNNSKPKLKLLYQSLHQGDFSRQFHSKYGEISPWVVLIKTKEGSRFGCYSVSPLYGRQTLFRDLKDFIFSFDINERYNAVNFTYLSSSNSDDFLVFGDNDIVISNNFLYVNSYSRFPNAFGDKNNSTQRYLLTNGKEEFFIEDLEFYQVHY